MWVFDRPRLFDAQFLHTRQGAVLFGAGKVRKLMAAGGLREIGARYFLLLPWEAKPARRVEGALSNVPLGAQYAAFGTA